MKPGVDPRSDFGEYRTPLPQVGYAPQPAIEGTSYLWTSNEPALTRGAHSRCGAVGSNAWLVGALCRLLFRSDERLQQRHQRVEFTTVVNPG